MGNGSEERNIRRGHTEGRGNHFEKITVALILTLALQRELPALDGNLFWIGDAGKALAGLHFDRKNGGMSEWNGYMQFGSKNGDWETDFRLLAGYEWLGEFIFAESEGFAYRNVRGVNGYGLCLLAGAKARWHTLSLECEAGWSRKDIGGGEFLSDDPLFGCALDWTAPFGKLIGNARFTEGGVVFAAGYVFSGTLDKAGYELSATIGRDVNTTVGAGIALINYRRDLRVAFRCRYGLIYPVNDLFRLDVEKTLGVLKLSFTFTPSSEGDSLIGAGIVWVFGGVE